MEERRNMKNPILNLDSNEKVVVLATSLLLTTKEWENVPVFVIVSKVANNMDMKIVDSDIVRLTKIVSDYELYLEGK